MNHGSVFIHFILSHPAFHTLSPFPLTAALQDNSILHF